MAIKKTTEEFKKELKLIQPELEVIGIYEGSSTKILVKTKYGICLCNTRSLLLGSKPTIQSAVNKTEYFINQMKQKHPELEVAGEYVNASSYIRIENKYGLCMVKPVELIVGKKPTIQSAINKNDYWIKQAKEIHGNKYDYSKVQYINNRLKIIIICTEHGEFIQAPDKHLMNQGCPECANQNNGYSRTDYINKANGRECILYKIRCFNDNETFFKIGITMNTVNKRFNCKQRMPYEYEVISETKGSAGFIYDLENEEHRKHKEHSYKPLLDFKGYTECFTILLS